MRAFVLLGFAACTTGASSDLGLGAMLQVEGAQFRPGAFPDEDGGPEALDVQTFHSMFEVGSVKEPLRAVLAPEARGAVIGLAGYDGSWIVSAGFPDFETPNNPSAMATIGFAADLPPGSVTLLLGATDAAGRIGAPARREVLALDAPVPDGELVIGLYWTGRADLDIHVVDPLGGEAYSRDPNTAPQPRPGEPVDPMAYLKGGVLDHDGNKDCRRDGSPNEHVVWSMPPPDGEYIVRVDARSLCGDAGAAWEVRAYRSGERVGRARGVSAPEDVLYAHGAGAGVLALQLTCSSEGCVVP